MGKNRSHTLRCAPSWARAHTPLSATSQSPTRKSRSHTDRCAPSWARAHTPPLAVSQSPTQKQRPLNSGAGGWPLRGLRLSYGQPKPTEGSPAPFPSWYLVYPLRQQRAVKAARVGGPSGGYGCPTASPSLQRGHPPPSSSVTWFVRYI